MWKMEGRQNTCIAETTEANYTHLQCKAQYKIRQKLSRFSFVLMHCITIRKSRVEKYEKICACYCKQDDYYYYY